MEGDIEVMEELLGVGDGRKRFDREGGQVVERCGSGEEPLSIVRN